MTFSSVTSSPTFARPPARLSKFNHVNDNNPSQVMQIARKPADIWFMKHLNPPSIHPHIHLHPPRMLLSPPCVDMALDIGNRPTDLLAAIIPLTMHVTLIITYCVCKYPGWYGTLWNTLPHTLNSTSGIAVDHGSSSLVTQPNHTFLLSPSAAP